MSPKHAKAFYRKSVAKLFLPFTALLFLNACALWPLGDRGGPPATPVAVETTEPGAFAVKTDIVLTAEKIGGLRPGMRFNEGALAAAFPNYDIVTEIREEAGRAYNLFHVEDGGARLVTVTPDRQGLIFSAIVRSPVVRNGLGAAIGDTWAEVYGADGVSDCGVSDDVDYAECAAPNADNIVYGFENDDAPIIAPGTDAVAKDAVLTTIIWRALP